MTAHFRDLEGWRYLIILWQLILAIYKIVCKFVFSKKRTKRVKDGKIIYSNWATKLQALLYIMLTPMCVNLFIIKELVLRE